MKYSMNYSMILFIAIYSFPIVNVEGKAMICRQSNLHCKQNLCWNNRHHNIPLNEYLILSINNKKLFDLYLIFVILCKPLILYNPLQNLVQPIQPNKSDNI